MVQIKGLGMVHKGFITALGLKICSLEDDNLLGDSQGDFPKQINYNKKDPQRLAYYTIKEKLEEIMENNERAKFIVTGHSLGGALAILFPAILAFHGEVKLLNKLEAIYTFGQPRVGDRKFGMFMKRKLRKHNIKYYRIVYGYDIVPRVPFDNVLMMFKHFGTCIHFDSLYHGKIVEEEEIEPVEKKTFLKVYFGALRQAIVFWMCIILGRLTAIWELIRGFMIGFTAGPYYREGWLLIGARIIGMILPEFTDHNPQDYLNATLLASEDLFKYYPTLN
ncbi:Lipase [Bienertia sinuspersici]